MEISVVIPSWNRKQIVSRAIQSVLNQSLPAAEIVVVDDGSDDGTAEMISQRFPQVTLLQQSNKGVSAARNTGVKQAQHQWIALLDSDDEWLPDKLSSQQNVLQQQPEVQICHTDEIWVRSGKRVNPMQKHAKPDGWIFEQCLPLCCVSPSSVLLHRSILDDVGLFDESLPACEDYDLWLRIFRKYPVVLESHPLLVKYGGHSDQLSKKYWGMDRFRVQALVKLLQDGKLNISQRLATVKMLEAKCKILVDGFTKRDKHDQAEHYADICRKWCVDGL